MIGHQLYMCSYTRSDILEQHDFFVAEVKKRVLDQFSDIESEAEHFADSEYYRLGSLPGDDSSDMSDIAEIAQDNAIGFYGLLHDLRKQMYLGALAGCYHQWDKGLRKFLERELSHTLNREDAIRYSWPSNLGKVFDLLEHFKWNCRQEAFYKKIDACRLIVNVHKHGKGGSLKKLATRYPEFLKNPLKDIAPMLAKGILDHEYLQISEDQFDEMTSALRTFWVEFPERLYVPFEKA